MSNLIVPVAGAFLGSYFGPTGMQIGWLLGSYATGGGKSNSGSSQDNLLPAHIMTAQYGVPLNVVYGMDRVGGNIIYAADAEPYNKVQSQGSTGKGGLLGGGSSSTQQTQQGYYLTYAVAICQGPILGIRRVWENGDLVIDCTSGSKPLPGQLYLGSNTQNPDPTLQSRLGAANVPAYRGVAYMVMNRIDNGASSTPPQLSFEVVRNM
jgi:hypothetical protein